MDISQVIKYSSSIDGYAPNAVLIAPYKECGRLKVKVLDINVVPWCKARKTFMLGRPKINAVGFSQCTSTVEDTEIESLKEAEELFKNYEMLAGIKPLDGAVLLLPLQESNQTNVYNRLVAETYVSGYYRHERENLKSKVEKNETAIVSKISERFRLSSLEGLVNRFLGRTITVSLGKNYL